MRFWGSHRLLLSSHRASAGSGPAPSRASAKPRPAPTAPGPPPSATPSVTWPGRGWTPSSGEAPQPPAPFPTGKQSPAREAETRGRSAARSLRTDLLQGRVHGRGVRRGARGAGHYFRLPRPAAVSTLAALTSPAPAAGGAERRRSCPAARPAGTLRLAEGGARPGGRGGASRGGASRLPYSGVTPAGPNAAT